MSELKHDEVFALKRYISLHGGIDSIKAEKITDSLFRLEAEDPTKDIVMVINSIGGYVDSMFCIIDVMNLIRCDVTTVCIGTACSAASVILLNGTAGKRYITPNARVMIHEISGGSYGKLLEIEDNVQEMKRRQDQVNKMILSKTKIKEDKLKEMLQHDYYLSPDDAKKYGVVDKCISSFKELKMRNW